ncbi:MAG: hypothetical protein LBC61_02370 [Candidatus Peribacteria bacterium]|nr:hypothetical protein [Candidatus Peribacteria bacterium]
MLKKSKVPSELFTAVSMFLLEIAPLVILSVIQPGLILGASLSAALVTPLGAATATAATKAPSATPVLVKISFSSSSGTGTLLFSVLPFSAAGAGVDAVFAHSVALFSLFPPLFSPPGVFS